MIITHYLASGKFKDPKDKFIKFLQPTREDIRSTTMIDKQRLTRWVTLLVVILGINFHYAQADCYPGNVRYTELVQEIYHDVTSDSMSLEAHVATPMLTRSALCTILVNRHNSGTNPGQTQTNAAFLGTTIPHYKCQNALTYTNGYNSLSGWQAWAGNHSGTWYGTTQQFTDGAKWYNPIIANNPTVSSNSFQKVRFDSQDRMDNCVTKDMTGATCRYGWNQSGYGVQYVWGWDPKNNYCSPHYHLKGKVGTVVGFTFDYGGADCIIWVTKQEAFLECVKNSRRTSAASGPNDREGYGQWTLHVLKMNYGLP